MPTLPWTPGPARDTDGETLVMASRFQVRRLVDVPGFLLAAMRVFAQVRTSDGAVGVTLQAHPLRREFFTLSQWRDQTSLDAMVTAQPHHAVMKRQREVMSDSAFRFWTEPAGATPNWDDAKRRLAVA